MCVFVHAGGCFTFECVSVCASGCFTLKRVSASGHMRYLLSLLRRGWLALSGLSVVGCLLSVVLGPGGAVVLLTACCCCCRGCWGRRCCRRRSRWSACLSWRGRDGELGVVYGPAIFTDEVIKTVRAKGERWRIISSLWTSHFYRLSYKKSELQWDRWRIIRRLWTSHFYRRSYKNSQQCFLAGFAIGTNSGYSVCERTAPSF